MVVVVVVVSVATPPPLIVYPDKSGKRGEGVRGAGCKHRHQAAKNNNTQRWLHWLKQYIYSYRSCESVLSAAAFAVFPTFAQEDGIAF